MSEKLVMPFGKHQGELVEDVPAAYLIWAYENINDLDVHLSSYIEQNIDE